MERESFETAYWLSKENDAYGFRDPSVKIYLERSNHLAKANDSKKDDKSLAAYRRALMNALRPGQNSEDDAEKSTAVKYFQNLSCTPYYNSFILHKSDATETSRHIRLEGVLRVPDLLRGDARRQDLQLLHRPPDLREVHWPREDKGVSVVQGGLCHCEPEEVPHGGEGRTTGARTGKARHRRAVELGMLVKLQLRTLTENIRTRWCIHLNQTLIESITY